MGFFNFKKDPPKSKRAPLEQHAGARGGRSAKSHLAEQAALGCGGCPLNNNKNLINPKMEPSGSAKPLVYFLGDSPSREDDEVGEHFQGKSGFVVRKSVPEDVKVRWNNVVRCRTPGGRKPTPVELACCAQKQIKDIEETKPAVVVGCGPVPLNFVLGPVGKTDPWRGRKIAARIGKHICWFIPTSDPHLVLRMLKGKKGAEFKAALDRDVKGAVTFARSCEEPPVEDLSKLEEGAVYLYEFEKIKAALKEAMKWKAGAIDIETNALRPFFSDARILTIALSNFDKTIVYPVAHSQTKLTPKQQKEILALTIEVLRTWERVWAHNSKFEMEWLAHSEGDQVLFEVKWHDTMAQAYVLDEREGAKGLGNLTQIHFGFDVKKQSDIKVARLDQELIGKVLRYNGMDAKYTFALQFVQEALIAEEGLEGVYVMQNDRAPTLVKAQMKGLPPNPPAIKKFYAQLNEECDGILKQVLAHKDVKRYMVENPNFVPTNPLQLAPFFYHFLGYKQINVNYGKEDAPEKLSTDESILSEVKHKVAELMLKYRGRDKLRTTYILPLVSPSMEGIRKEHLEKGVGYQVHEDGLIHTSFNHLRTTTGRLSSEDPNIQNFPKREDKEIRNVVIAPKRYKVVSIDYGQIEARVLGMLSKDRFLTNALWEDYDIHQVWAEKIAKAYPPKLKKYMEEASGDNKKAVRLLRQDVKNLWTFPLFYGSVLAGVAHGLNIPDQKLSPLFDEFWDTFKDVRAWQDKVRDNYKKNFYVETITGRRRRGPLSHNEMINSPIQGSASDVVMAAMVRLARIAYEQDKPHYQPVMNIHDDLTFFIPEASLEEDILFLAEEMCRPAFSWITCPVLVEVSVGDTWGAQEDIAKFSSVDFGHARRETDKAIAKAKATRLTSRNPI